MFAWILNTKPLNALSSGMTVRAFVAKVNFEFHRYNCKHAFANETADSKGLDMLKYDPKAAEQAWKRTMDFLARQLK